jgi:hypothetical protein
MGGACHGALDERPRGDSVDGHASAPPDGNTGGDLRTAAHTRALRLRAP